MTERSASELLENMHGTRRAIDAAFDRDKTQPIARELDAWIDELRPQLDRGEVVIAGRHLDDAREQLFIIRGALARNDVEDFLAISRPAAQKLGSLRKTARATGDSVLPGNGENIDIKIKADSTLGDSALPGNGENMDIGKR